jgi:hypothetical protein
MMGPESDAQADGWPGRETTHPPVLFRLGFYAVSWACAGDARRGCVQSEPGFQNDGKMRERCLYRIEDSA